MRVQKHGAYHFEEESQNSLIKPRASQQYTRIRAYVFNREIDLIPLLIGLIAGILLTLLLSAIFGLFHHVKTQETIEIAEAEKNSAIQNLTNETDYRIKVLSSDLFDFSRDLQNLYDSIHNYTWPDGQLSTAHDYLVHIRKIGEKLEECQLLGDELVGCKNKTKKFYKKYTREEINKVLKITADGPTRASVLTLITDAINEGTTADGNFRNHTKICLTLKSRLQASDSTHYYTCFFGNAYAYSAASYLNARLNLPDGDQMIVYRE